MCDIVVTNKYKESNPKGFIECNIMRGHPLGNPFKMKQNTDYERYRVIKLYEMRLNRIVKTNDKLLSYKERVFKSELEAIILLYRSDVIKGINLQCCCKPKLCHGDILKEFIENN